RGLTPGLLREELEGTPLVLDEALPLDQVLGRIPADHLLGVDGDGHVGGGHLLREAQRPLDVGVGGAHRGVHRREADLHQTHRQFTGPSGLAGASRARTSLTSASTERSRSRTSSSHNRSCLRSTSATTLDATTSASAPPEARADAWSSPWATGGGSLAAS